MRRAVLGLILWVLTTSLCLGAPRIKFPKELLQWDLLTWDEQSQSMILNPAHAPYHLKAPLFTDFALKLRTLSIPAGKKIVLQGGKFKFPDGSLISKTFYYKDSDVIINERDASRYAPLKGPWGEQHIPLETRLLVKKKGYWYPLVYVWDARKKNAYLVKIGKKIKLTYLPSNENFTYKVPNRNQCLGCHINYNSYERKARPLGPENPGNMDLPYLAKNISQIEEWTQRGWLDPPPPQSYDQWAQWDDESEDLNLRARSYLAINCAHCHNANGPAASTGLFLGKEIQAARTLGVCKTPVATGRGSGGRPYSIFPAKSEESIIPYRMASKNPSVMMPELGRTLVHHRGVKLINKWINAMAPKNCL